MKKNLKAVLASKVPSIRASMVVAGVAFAPLFARAADGDVDTGPIVAKIVSMGTAAGVIGLAYLTVVLGVKAFKLLRSAA
jgi:hypothetical protein